jgi:hypothetical protein
MEIQSDTNFLREKFDGEIHSVFPKMENLQSFKNHLHVTLGKFTQPSLVAKAHEELSDLMSEHITNSDRMNAFLAALAGPGDKNSPNNKA